MNDVLCLYYLTFYARFNGQKHEISSMLNEVFIKIWYRLEPLLDEDLEQNIEYSHNQEKNCYFRVPWQLYLMALVAHYRFYRKFCTAQVQKKLARILQMVESDTIPYPHSGQNLSTRTYSILYDVLNRVHDELNTKKVAPFYIVPAIESVRRFLGNAWVRALVSIPSAIIIVMILYKYFKKQNGNDGFAINLISTILWTLMTFMLWSKKDR